jgi:hypothetical protein
MANDVTTLLSKKLAALLLDAYTGAPGGGLNADMRDMNGTLQRYLTASVKGEPNWDADGAVLGRVDLNTAIVEDLT